MLSNKSKSVLKKISEFDTISLKDLATYFPELNSSRLKSIIKHLISLVYIKDTNVLERTYVDASASPIYKITEEGRAYLDKINNNKNQHTQNILINILCVLLGALLDNIPEFVSWLIVLISGQ